MNAEESKFIADYNKRAKYAVKFYNDIEPFMPIIENLSKQINYKYCWDKPTFSKVEYDFDTMEDTVFKFFEDFDHDLYTSLRSVLKSDLTNIDKSEPCEKNEKQPSYVVALFTLFREVTLNPPNTYEGFLHIAHEYCHCVSQRMKQLKFAKSDYVGEIESLFIEKLFRDWLYENGVISERDYRVHCERKYCDLCLASRWLVEERNSIFALKPPVDPKTYEEFVSSMTHKKEKVLKNLHRFTYSNTNIKDGTWNYRYILGELVATALYEDYKDFPVSTKIKFCQFLEHNADLTEEESCQMLLGEDYIQKIYRTFNFQAEDEQKI